MPDDEHDYKVGPGRPPLHTRFRKGQSGNPGGRSKKNLPALLADALNEPVFVTIDGERRQITKREAVVHQLVNKSTSADLRATKMLFDMMKDAEQKAGVAAPAPEPRPLEAADKEVVQLLKERLRRQILAEMGMTHDELVEELHELKRRNETPIPLIEMFDALLSLDPRLSAKQKRKSFDKIMAATLERLERKDA